MKLTLNFSITNHSWDFKVRKLTNLFSDFWRFIKASVVIIIISIANSLFYIQPVQAATGGYPHWNAYAYNAASYDWRVDENNDGDYTDGYPLYEWYSPRMYNYRNCTDYVAWKLESLGVPSTLTRGNGNGGNWDNARAQLASSTPKPGSAATKDGTTTNTAGHVSFVEAVYGNGTIKVSEYNGNRDGNYGERIGTPSALGINHFLDFGVKNYGVTSFMNDIYSTSGSNIVVSPSGNSSWINLKATGGSINSMLMGDFDSDGKVDDVFQATGSVWQYSVDGKYSWQFLRNSTSQAAKLRIGDYDGDGKLNDIYSTTGSNIIVSRNDTSAWINLKSTSGSIDNMLMGDFDSDGHVDDVFIATGNNWQYSVDGKYSWQFLRNSTTRIGGLRIGAYDIDGKLNDLYSTSGSHIVVSRNGKYSWVDLKTTGGSIDSMLVGDFDSDGKVDDIFQATGTLWQYSIDGKSNWKFLRNSTTKICGLRIGVYTP